jgi:hypothetical protein
MMVGGVRIRFIAVHFLSCGMSVRQLFTAVRTALWNLLVGFRGNVSNLLSDMNCIICV